MLKKLVIAIDGPAGSGKSTSARLVAQKLGFLYIDTGAMYRAVTYLAMKQNVLSDQKEIELLAEKALIVLKYIEGSTRVSINGEDVTNEIRTPEINSKVSDVSKIQGVRKALVEKQRQMGHGDQSVVMEGRDIGSVVFPDADVKIFLTATIDERTKRRSLEFIDKGMSVPVETIKENLLHRDKIDSTREVSPLIKPADAVEVDTSYVTIEEQVNIIIEKVKEAASKKGMELKLENT
ncbi:MAG: (d)CMP kinase [Ignavibacteriales bacterium]|nr:MAG: (d)CMP kinase [Ignavibacteriales bacterium]